MPSRRPLPPHVEFLLLPVVLWALRDTLRPLFLPVLWGLGGYAWWRLRRQPAPERADELMPHLRRLLLRFLVVALPGTVVMAWGWPELFLSFPRSRPGLWAAVMVCHPFLSVLPQALLFRAWFHTHHDHWLGDGRLAWMAGALCFAWAHLFFHHPLALLLTLAGGLMFADTWRRTRSLALSILEHALYGNWVFTVGLGRFLYAGTVQSVERIAG